MEGVIRPQNSKNSKRLVQDFLAKGPCLTGAILLAGPVHKAAWKRGQLDCKGDSTAWEGVTDFSACSWKSL